MQFLGAFANKFLKFADVRFYCLQAIGQVCNVLSANSATAEDVEDEDEEVEEAERGEPKGPSNDTLSASDIARNCFDLLCVVPERCGQEICMVTSKQTTEKNGGAELL